MSTLKQTLKNPAAIIVALQPAVMPISAFAALADLSTCQGLLDFLGKIGTTFSAIVGTIAIIMLLVAAFQFLTAGGDPGKVGTARQSLVWALIGIAVALLAYILPDLIQNIVGGAFEAGC